MFDIWMMPYLRCHLSFHFSKAVTYITSIHNIFDISLKKVNSSGDGEATTNKTCFEIIFNSFTFLGQDIPTVVFRIYADQVV